MSDNESLDLTLLEGYIDNIGTDIVLQMLDLYINQSKIYLEDILSASASASQTDWHESCHKMKGSAGSVGLKAVHAKLAILEHSTANSATKQEEVTALIELNQLAIEKLKVWLNNK